MPQDHDLDSVEAGVTVWIAALESGRYEQSTHTMYDGHGYCCFGVAAKVVFGDEFYPHEDTWADSTGQTEMLEATRLALLDMNTLARDDDIEAFQETLRDYYHEPDATSLRASLCTDEYGEPIRPARYVVLAALNDASVPFEAIARYIRASGWLAPLIDRAGGQ